MHKLYLTLILVLIGTLGFSQNTGTLKMAKKKQELPIEPVDNFNGNGFRDRYFGSIITTFAAESSPERIRDLEVKLGFRWDLIGNQHYLFTVGAIGGKSQPAINFNGFTTGAFIQHDYRIMIGATHILLPILELSYKRLFNSLDGGNMNLYSAGAGVAIYLPSTSLGGLYISFFEYYRSDVSAENSFKGFFPALGLDYRF